MNLLLDTNIILHIIRAKDHAGVIRFINPDNSKLYLSIVSDAEMQSFVIRKKWGYKRLSTLNNFLNQTNIVDINQSSVKIYAEIDAYSQKLNPDFENYDFDSPRNMGKNDLWIASLAALLGLKLVTTDADFDHLHQIFFEVQKVSSRDFLPFF